jgi:predicted DNA-binding protein
MPKVTEDPVVTTSIGLPLTLRERLDRAVAEAGTSMSAIVRESLELTLPPVQPVRTRRRKKRV